MRKTIAIAAAVAAAVLACAPGAAVAEGYEEDMGEWSAEYLAELAGKVYVFAPYKDISLKMENVEVLPKPIKAVSGGMKANKITLTDGTEVDVDGLFCLRNSLLCRSRFTLGRSRLFRSRRLLSICRDSFCRICSRFGSLRRGLWYVRCGFRRLALRLLLRSRCLRTFGRILYGFRCGLCGCLGNVVLHRLRICPGSRGRICFGSRS